MSSRKRRRRRSSIAVTQPGTLSSTFVSAVISNGGALDSASTVNGVDPKLNLARGQVEIGRAVGPRPNLTAYAEHIFRSRAASGFMRRGRLVTV